MDLSNKFQTWRTILIGTFMDVSVLKKTLLDSGFHIGSWADDVLEGSNFTLSHGERVVNLVRIAPQDFGFQNGAYRTDIYKRALEVGFELCPIEIGPQLRLQYIDQPKLESLQIAMEPQLDSKGHESEFRIVHGEDNFLWLAGDHRHPDDFWTGKEYFIFTKKS
jgi:hypothetical protein